MRNSKAKYFFLFPGILTIFLTTIVPIISVINISFRDWRVAISPTPGDFVYFDNYIRAFSDENFWNAVWVTFAYTFITTVFSIAIGLFIAITLQKNSLSSNFVKATLIFPFAISMALRGYSFRFMLLEGSGILDVIIDYLIPPLGDILWLGDPNWAVFWLSVPIFWAWGPLSGLMLIGALNNISEEIFEAANLDGANPWRTFWSITFPLLRPMILVIVLLITLFSIRMFDLVQTMTAGGPGRATETLNYFIYQVGFRFFDMGYASALAIILTIILIILSYLYARILVE